MAEQLVPGVARPDDVADRPCEVVDRLGADAVVFDRVMPNGANDQNRSQ